MSALPVITSCDGCGACCTHIPCPPGYPDLILHPGLDGFDRRQVARLPDDARKALLDWIGDGSKDVFRRYMTENGPCCWFDVETRKCRWHAWRPSICREFEMGGDDCRKMMQDQLEGKLADAFREMVEEAREA